MMKKALILGLGLAIFFSCSKEENSNENKIFSKLSSTESGIDFNNILIENDTLNYFTYTYLYMGGGIATGDINNDGLTDLFFTGNQVENKLYLNKGNLQFEDITKSAKVEGNNSWYTGVTMADVNGDGFLDIYCSVAGNFGTKENELYINNGDGTFTEKASEFGLNDKGNSVQATFFDYDKDGDLDVYVANYPPTKFSTQPDVYMSFIKYVTDVQSDHLYRNDGNTFTKVTDEAGVKNYGLSLSATAADLNNDGWEDLYVSNDFCMPDYLYINNQDGTFKEVVKEAAPHTAYYGMGADIADFNNDGFLDIFQVDMDAQSNRRKKANMASMNPDLFWSVVESGFGYQYMHNVMQLNSGVVENGIPKFTNISRITGTSSTDWSWAPLFADFDNDGNKDLFVTNGTRKEINHNDYFDALENNKDISLLEASVNMPTEKLDNFIYKNNGNLEFKQANKEWGIEFEGFSNGAVYADLDNDGDLEIIINNIDDKVAIFKNNSSENNNYLTVKFKSETANKFGLGNRVYVTANGETQMQELTLSRGFQSSVAPELHFGLGKSEKIDEIKVVWTDGKIEKINDASINKTIIFNHTNAVENNEIAEAKSTIFQNSETNLFPKHKHQENIYDDFKNQILLPHKMSSFGPALAVGDLNGDELDDFFIGGSKGNLGTIQFQKENGFEAQSVFEDDKNSEDVGAHIFDADNDGDNDLYVVSGGYEFAQNAPELQDRLYINDGKGNFTKATLPNMPISGSKVYTEDFDNDGKLDLLVLGRQSPKNYPVPTSSYLLRNTSEKDNLSFEEIQPEAFKNLGMATSAVISDINGDDLKDIIIVGEWMPIKVFKNDGDSFKEVSDEVGLDDTTGWYWSIKEGDFDNDGDIDFIVGNNGLNYKYQATENETFDIYVNDFDKNDKSDIVLSYYNEGEQYPVRGRECSSQQIPGIKNKFENYETFSEATLVDVYSKKELENALHYQVKSFASVYLENKNGKFIIHKLPVEAQLSSINQILVDDFDNDGNLDAVIAGNLYVSEVETPRNDASYGLFLKGNGNGAFNAVPPNESGLFTPGDIKDMATIKVKGKTYIISAKNDDYLQFTKIVK